MASTSTAPYIHPGSALKPTHQRTTSRCEKVLRDLLAKDADRHPRRPFVSTERTRQNNDSVKHWLAQSDSSIQSQLVLSSPSSLTRSTSLSSKPTYLTTSLPATTKSVVSSISNFFSILIFLQFSSVSHSALANNDADPLSPSPSQAVPEPHTQTPSHFAHTQTHRYHQSLTGPQLAFQPTNLATPNPHRGPPPDHSHPLPDRSTQHQTQNTYIPTRNFSVGPFGAPTQFHQTPPSPIQCPATAPILRNRSSTSMSPNNVQNSHPRLPPRITRKPSASSANMDPSPVRSISQHHRLHAAYLTDWTTAESPDVSIRPTLATLLHSNRLTIDHSLAGRVHPKPHASHGVVTESLLHRLHASHASARTYLHPTVQSAVIRHQSCQRSLSGHSRLRVLLRSRGSGSSARRSRGGTLRTGETGKGTANKTHLARVVFE
jgi:hypothetical protein